MLTFHFQTSWTGYLSLAHTAIFLMFLLLFMCYGKYEHSLIPTKALEAMFLQLSAIPDNRIWSILFIHNCNFCTWYSHFFPRLTQLWAKFFFLNEKLGISNCMDIKICF